MIHRTQGQSPSITTGSSALAEVREHVSDTNHGNSGWYAELGLSFSLSHGRSIVARSHRGPLTMQRPFYPEGDGVCHVYALHPPGGIVGGDTLSFDVMAKMGSHGLVTTPAAGKFYKTAGPEGRQVQSLRVEDGGTLEWLPQETIIYPGARARMATRVDLFGNANFMGWDVVCLGMPASRALFDHGELIQSMEIYRDDEPLLVERGVFHGGTAIMNEPWGLDSHTVFGSLVATGGTPEVGTDIRRMTDGMDDKGCLSLTQMDGLTVCRAVGDNAFKVRDLLAVAWAALRPATIGLPASPPRVWNT